PARPDDAVTPFDLLEPVMATHVSLCVNNTPLTIYPVPPEEVHHVRAKVRALAVEHGSGPDIRRACAAVQLIRVVSARDLVIYDPIEIGSARHLPRVPGFPTGRDLHDFHKLQPGQGRDDDSDDLDPL